MSAVKPDQLGSIPGAGILEQAVIKCWLRCLVTSQPTRVFWARFLNSRFPNYPGAWNAHFFSNAVRMLYDKVENEVH